MRMEIASAWELLLFRVKRDYKIKIAMDMTVAIFTHCSISHQKIFANNYKDTCGWEVISDK